MGGGSVVVFHPRLLKCSFFFLNNPTHHTHSNSSWSTKGQNPLLGLQLALSMPFMRTSPSIVSKSPSRGLAGRISHQNKLRYLTKVSFCYWVYFVTFRQKRMHLDRLAWFGLELWPSNQRQEGEERPEKREGVKSDVHFIFHSRKQLTIIITHLVLQLRIKVALHQPLPKQPSWLESTPHLGELRRHEHNFKCKLNWGGSRKNT